MVALSTHGWVQPGTVAVVERAAAGAPLTWPAGWEPWPHRVYGDTRLELAERLSACTVDVMTPAMQSGHRAALMSGAVCPGSFDP